MNNELKTILVHYKDRSVNPKMFAYCLIYYVPFAYDGDCEVKITIHEDFYEEFQKRLKADNWSDVFEDY